MEGILASIASSDKNRGERYMELIEEKIGMKDAKALQFIVDHLTSEEVFNFF
jgi:hypothetical protein